MPQDKQEMSMQEAIIQEVIKTNKYTKETELKFREFMKGLSEEDNKHDNVEEKADTMISQMEQGVDVLREGKKENHSSKNLGFIAPWFLGLISGLITAVATIGLIFLTR